MRPFLASVGTGCLLTLRLLWFVGKLWWLMKGLDLQFRGELRRGLRHMKRALKRHRVPLSLIIAVADRYRNAHGNFLSLYRGAWRAVVSGRRRYRRRREARFG